MLLSFICHSIMLIVWFIFSGDQNEWNTWFLRGLGDLLLNWPKANTSTGKRRTSSKSEPQPHGAYLEGMENKENRFVLDFGLSCRRHKRMLLLKFSGNILSTRSSEQPSAFFMNNTRGNRLSEVEFFIFSDLSDVQITLAPIGHWKESIMNEENHSYMFRTHTFRGNEGSCLCSALRLPPPRSTLSSQMSTTTTPSLTLQYLLTSPSEKKKPTYLWASSGWVWRLSRLLTSADTTGIRCRLQTATPYPCCLSQFGTIEQPEFPN